MRQYSAKINGKKILYKGQANAVITTHFTMWQRIKILFGSKCITAITIYTAEPITVTGQLIETIVAKPLKQKPHELLHHTDTL